MNPLKLNEVEIKAIRDMYEARYNALEAEVVELQMRLSHLRIEKDEIIGRIRDIEDTIKPEGIKTSYNTSDHLYKKAKIILSNHNYMMSTGEIADAILDIESRFAGFKLPMKSDLTSSLSATLIQKVQKKEIFGRITEGDGTIRYGLLEWFSPTGDPHPQYLSII